MSSCDQIKLLIGPFEDGELEPHEMEDVALHVVTCEACKVALEDYRSLGVALRDCCVQPISDRFTAAVLKRIDEIPRPLWMRWRAYIDTMREHFGAAASLVAAGAFTALVTAWLISPYAQRLLHRSPAVVQVTNRTENQNKLPGSANQIADQAESSAITLSSDPTTTVIWLPNQP
jgi:anti-sigma factor RsiW